MSLNIGLHPSGFKLNAEAVVPHTENSWLSTGFNQRCLNTTKKELSEKMQVRYADPVHYRLPLGDDLYPIDSYIGKVLSMTFCGNIFCIACGRKTNRSFAQGYCYPCFKNLAECDLCIMRPETCHYHKGTCRDVQWADTHCMQQHYVYLANSSGLKVGITRGTQLQTRWIDQGASQAIPIFKVKNRLHSGLIEATLKQYVNDRTDWRKMLKGEAASIDLESARDELLRQAEPDLKRLDSQYPDLERQPLDEPAVKMTFPVSRYPEKVVAVSFDKTPAISGILNGIKGQYLLLDIGVLNIRKFAGYEITIA